jgi:hypothetical protein
MLSRQFTSCSLAAIAGAFTMMMAATTADAAILPAPVSDSSIFDVQLAGDVCGPGRRPGANGVCHPESWFLRRAACPPGTHLGAARRRCWPN